MSGNLNNGFELFPFHLVLKFSRTEAKYLLFLPPVYSPILTAILKAWLLSCAHRFQHVVFVLLELHKYSNNLPITVSAAPTDCPKDTARGVSFHGLPVNNHSLRKE